MRITVFNHDANGLKDLIKPFPDYAIDYYEVSKDVNSVKNNSEQLLDRVA